MRTLVPLSSSERRAVQRRPSRVHSAVHVLDELRRLRVKVQRAYEVRDLSDVEQRWCLRAADALDAVIADGTANLPPNRDPRPSRRARKRPVQRPLTVVDTLFS